MAESATPSPTTRPATKKPKFKWGFVNGGGVLLLLCLYFAVPWALFEKLHEATGPFQVGSALLLFLALLPYTVLAVWRPRQVFAFLKSVKVGVMNLVLIGIGSIIGVLFFQENPNDPIPPGAISSLANLVESGETREWTMNEKIAYDKYAGISGRSASFRNAQSFFVYRFAESMHLDGLFGLDPALDIDHEGIQEKLALVEKKLPEIEERYGKDYVIAIRKQSEIGLLTRGRNKRIQAVEEKFDDSWWSLFVWADRLDLIRVYKAPWFAFCFVLLFCGVFLNTWRGGPRLWARPSRWGFLATHLGVMLVCVGGGFSRCSDQRGILELNVGKSSALWQQWDGDRVGFHGKDTKENEPVFKVELDSFRADLHNVLNVNYIVTEDDGRQYLEFPLDSQPEERIWEGRVLKFDYQRDEDGELGPPRLQIKVKSLIHQSRLDRDLQPALANETPTTMARIALSKASGGKNLELPPLSETGNNVWVHALSGSKVRLISVANESAAREALGQVPETSLGRLVRDDATADQRRHEVRIGNSFEDQTINGTYKVEVLHALPTLKLLEGSNGKFIPEEADRDLAYLDILNAAVQLRITAPNGEIEMRWVMEQDFSSSLPVEFSDLKYILHWDRWASPAKQRYLLMVGPDEQVWWGQVGKANELRAIETGSKLTLGQPVLFDEQVAEEEVIEIIEASNNASPHPTYAAVEDADFFDPAPAAALVEFEYPGSDGNPVTEEVWLRAKDGEFRHDVHYPGPNGEHREAIVFFYEQTSGMPIEWQSKLTILEEDQAGEWRKVDTGTVRVNDYLHYKGYRFFQTNHDPRDPTYSGIGVVYDPGIEMVLLGFYLVMFGTIVVFLIKPLLTKRHRAA